MVAWGSMVRPMLAQAIEEPFDSVEWTFEVKWDGTRVICFHGDGRTWFQNRRFKDITERYPEIIVEGPRRAIYDGEIVVLRDGRPNFQALQEREHVSNLDIIRRRSVETPASYVVFDILFLEGEDLTSLPLQGRREILAENLQGRNVDLCDSVVERGRALFEVARDRGLEGIIAKRLASPYQEGRRSRDWLKIKAIKTIDAVVCGLTTGAGGREDSFGALVLGVYRDGELVYIGRVGTGFDADLLREVMARARGLEGICPFKVHGEAAGTVRWLRPSIVCEVRYLEFTVDGSLRAPAFFRLREDKAPGDCLLPPGVPVFSTGGPRATRWRRHPGP